MTDRNTILKYIKVKALAEGGSPGERDNARRAMARMETENPGIQVAAAAFSKAENGGTPTATQDAPPPWSAAPWAGANWNAPGNWENIFQYAQSAFGTVADFTQKVANATLGTALSSYVETSTRMTKTGNVLLTFKLSYDLFEAVRDLNPIQQAAFRAAMHERLNEELDILMGVSDDEEDED